ncbi:MAG: UDP-N-acetylmuramoyl-L-alanine--D-glutamate ligase [Acidimicrobiales bacterium]
MAALVVGLGVTGEAVVSQLLARGEKLVVADDRAGVARALGEKLGVPYVEPDGDAEWADAVSRADLLLPSPGVPLGHAAIAAAMARQVPIWSEFELAARWDDRPIVAITGTNGKTTVTQLVQMMLSADGRRAMAAGNNEVPLIEALAADAEVFVVEASSFRLAFTESFRPRVAVWLNLSEDHLDWHPDLEHYAASKAKIWAHQAADDLAVVNADDPAVMAAAQAAPGRVVTFGADRGGYSVADGQILTPDGPLCAVADLPRRLPHDLANALAATAAAEGIGASAEACRQVLLDFHGFPHRVQLVREAGGVSYYDDSKATTPSSVVAAMSGFDSVVLIAGGRNKGLDLRPLASQSERLRGVVAIGDAAADVEAAFAGTGVAVVVAQSMDDAVAQAESLAGRGDVVLLSPGGASYDWYRNYGERGADFARAVNDLLDRQP